MSLQWKWLIIASWILGGNGPVSGLTVIDFEQYRGAGGGTPRIEGMTFDSDFAIYTSQLGQIPAHSGDVRVRSNAYAEGWRECSLTFNTPNQRFVGVWMYVFSDSAQLRMYKDGQLVATSITLQANSRWTFVESRYDGAVDRVGIWASRGYYVIDDIMFTTIDRPPAPRRAQARAIVSNGRITGLTVTDGGYGYRTAPEIGIADASGSGARAQATIADQAIQSIQVLDGGQNYSPTPQAVVGLPDFVAGLAVRFSKITIDMTLDIGQRYQLYSSADLTTWSMVGEPFVAESDRKSVELAVQPVWTYYRLRRLD